VTTTDLAFRKLLRTVSVESASLLFSWYIDLINNDVIPDIVGTCVFVSTAAIVMVLVRMFEVQNEEHSILGCDVV
jgi:hypothetical protein